MYTFDILVDAYSMFRKLDGAKWIIEMMNRRGQYPDIVTYDTIMQAYCLQGQMNRALSVQKTIRSRRIMPDCSTYAAILLDAYAGS